MGFFARIFGKSPELQRAEQFLNYGIGFAIQFIQDLHGHSAQVDEAIARKEFIYYCVIVALAAADFAAINRYGPGTPKCTDLLAAMIKSVEAANPHVRKNLMCHKAFLDTMHDEGRLHSRDMTIPAASGCWILMALGRENTIDLDDREVVDTGELIGEGIYSQFSTYWDDLTSE